MFDWWLGEAPDDDECGLRDGQRADARGRCCAGLRRPAGFPYDRLVYPQLAAGERSVSTQQARRSGRAGRGRARRAARARHTSARTTAASPTSAPRWPAPRSSIGFDAFPRTVRASRPLRVRLVAAAAPRRSRRRCCSRSARISRGRRRTQAAATSVRRPRPPTAWHEFEARLTAWQRWTLLPRVRWALRRLKQQYVWREAVRSDLTRVISRIRDWHLVLADRFVERGWIDRRDDYFLLELDEVDAAALDPSRGTGLAADRGAARGAARGRARSAAAAADARIGTASAAGRRPHAIRRRRRDAHRAVRQPGIRSKPKSS